MVSGTTAGESTAVATCWDDSKAHLEKETSQKKPTNVTHVSSHGTSRQKINVTHMSSHETSRRKIGLSHETSRHDLKTEETHLSRKKHDLRSIRSLKCIDDGSGDSGSAKDMSQDVGRPRRVCFKPERLIDVYGQSLVKGRKTPYRGS